MAAVTPPTTTGNLALPLRTHGHVALQKSVAAGFQSIDDYVTALEARVAAVEAALANSALDSNSQFSDSNSQF